MCYNMLMQVKVFSKLNLTLQVGARQGEFHPIDSVATSVDVCDVLDVSPRSDREVRVIGVEGVAQTRNTAYRAARAFSEAFSTNGVDVAIKKGIPFGAGLGGSSADAAAVLYCMCKLYGVDVECEQVAAICSQIGSDVTFMLRGGLGRLRGKGDKAEFFTLKRPIYFALTTFTQQMSSRDVYQAFDSLAKPCGGGVNDELLTLLERGANGQALKYLHNDLQQATVTISSYADKYLDFTKANGLNAVMTGSGSAYYVAFASRADAQKAVDLLNSHRFYSILCTTESSGILITD